MYTSILAAFSPPIRRCHDCHSLVDIFSSHRLTSCPSSDAKINRRHKVINQTTSATFLRGQITLRLSLSLRTRFLRGVMLRCEPTCWCLAKKVRLTALLTLPFLAFLVLRPSCFCVRRAIKDVMFSLPFLPPGRQRGNPLLKQMNSCISLDGQRERTSQAATLRTLVWPLGNRR